MSSIVKYSVKSNKTAAQIYIDNMIVGSYFANASNDSNLANQGLMDYRLMKPEDQVKAEARVISMMEKLPKDFLDSIADMRYSLSVQKSDDGVKVCFSTGFEEVVLVHDKAGKVVSIETMAA